MDAPSFALGVAVGGFVVLALVFLFAWFCDARIAARYKVDSQGVMDDMREDVEQMIRRRSKEELFD